MRSTLYYFPSGMSDSKDSRIHRPSLCYSMWTTINMFVPRISITIVSKRINERLVRGLSSTPINIFIDQDGPCRFIRKSRESGIHRLRKHIKAIPLIFIEGFCRRGSLLKKFEKRSNMPILPICKKNLKYRNSSLN